MFPNALCFAVWLGLTASTVRAADHWFIAGEEKTLDGRVSFTFWVKHDKNYLKLPDGTNPDVLLRGAKTETPPAGITIKNLTLVANLEKASSIKKQGLGVSQELSWEKYAIDGTWNVTVPQDCRPGDYTIAVSFPAVVEIRDQLGAVEPTGAPVIVLNVKVFASAAERSKEAREYNLPGLLGLAGFIAALAAILGGYIWFKRRFG
jgi:hypothetical protein